jgi:hypothetical protein
MNLVSIFRRTPRDGSGSIHGQIAESELLKLQKSGQFPDESVRIKDVQIRYVTSLPAVLAIAVINDIA